MDSYDQEQTDKEMLQRFELLQGGGEKDNVLDQWIDSLDHYVSTGAPMTLSAERTINLRALLVAVRDYINRAPAMDEPMSEEAWQAAGDLNDDDPDQEYTHRYADPEPYIAHPDRQ